MGQGPNVVVDLVKKAKLVPGSEVYVDNLFTSFPLSREMSDREIGITGTMRQNRLNKVPIHKKKELEKKDVVRGTFETVYKGDQMCVSWKDNKAVYMGSNQYGPHPITTVSQYIREAKAKLQVPCPNLVKQYNKNMGGVDLLDSMVATYQVSWRKKKWWWPIYSWSLNVMVYI